VASKSGSLGEVVFGFEFGEESGEVAAREGPLERLGGAFVVSLEAEEAVADLIERGEIVWGKDLSLDDREVDLDLVEPARVNGSMDQDKVRPGGAKAVGSALTAVRGAVVDDPEDTLGTAIWSLRHDLIHQPIEGGDAVTLFASAEDPGAVNVPGSQVGPGAAPRVFVFDVHRLLGTWGQGVMLAQAGLDAGLLVGGDQVVLGAQGSAVPVPLIQVQNPTGLGGEVGITREDPAAMTPWAKSIAAQPPPQSRSADLRDQSFGDHLTLDFSEGESRKRQPEPMRELTDQGLYVDDDAGGKSGLEPRLVVALRGRESGLQRIACATC
jgi:hypothetical protein